MFRFEIVSSDTAIQRVLSLYFPFIFPEVKDTSLWIIIVLSLLPKFYHIRAVISSPWLPLNTIKYSSTRSEQNLLVKMNLQVIWSNNFTTSTVDLAMICMPWYVCKLTNILHPAFWVKSPDLFWAFSFRALRYSRNWFVIQKIISWFSSVYSFRNGLVFFWCFSNLLAFPHSKNWSNIWQYLFVSEVSVVPKIWRILAVVSRKICTIHFVVIFK